MNAQYCPLLRLPRQAFAPSWSIWHYNWNKCVTLFFCTKAMKETSLSPVRFLIGLKRFHFHNGFTNLRTVGKCDFVRFNTQRLSKHEQLSKCLFAFHKKIHSIKIDWLYKYMCDVVKQATPLVLISWTSRSLISSLKPISQLQLINACARVCY